MITIFSHLLKPFGYLFIKGINGKKAYDWYAPAALTAISLIYFHFLKVPSLDLIKDGGFVKTASSFISNLPGFYIAALAAIATFNREEIDFPLIGSNGAPFIKVTRTKENGKTVDTHEKLTRRLFLCMLFSFLTALSLCILMLNAFATPLTGTYNNDIANWSYIIVFLFFTWQMLVSTFFGLYYLGDRIHIN
ncbi:hypothetical protein KKZ48_09045 [Enterobacter hormaechei subsp. xiangfangensis]|uniref:hypothetical protein n=1 Tax=Enterobacter hormaechei TaxID=158836 RepID=UPI0018C32BD4|nr:hypothetical protein [Enterobacter hormaechei]MBG0593852.1 hypothetical protein [Enterobacter hormaechei]MBT2045090.1 hypothetical protein [Enterobacter hormaechei subsp. xiangfangensis]MBT2094840.1 hypothetical protein [Enterobacter hormaechei subsp. xiangfangensis]